MVEAKIAVQGLDRKTVFDAHDIDYLVKNLSIEQLHQELRHADVEQSVARCFGEDDDLSYWQDYGRACKFALREKRDRIREISDERDRRTSIPR